jgi:hypothetical protein
VSATGGLDAAIRLGIGLEGVLNESSDGQAFVEFGIRQDAATNGSVRIPGRGALTARFRAPYWLISGRPDCGWADSGFHFSAKATEDGSTCLPTVA